MGRSSRPPGEARGRASSGARPERPISRRMAVLRAGRPRPERGRQFLSQGTATSFVCRAAPISARPATAEPRTRAARRAAPPPSRSPSASSLVSDAPTCRLHAMQIAYVRTPPSVSTEQLRRPGGRNARTGPPPERRSERTSHRARRRSRAPEVRSPPNSSAKAHTWRGERRAAGARLPLRPGRSRRQRGRSRPRETRVAQRPFRV